MNNFSRTRINFSKEQINACNRFATSMIGKHNPNMIMKRSDQEIFRDDFRGKLGEVAVLNFVRAYMPNATINAGIDYGIYERGKWDTFDLVINGKVISVKSVKQGSSFLMIEQFRFNPDGSYSYRNNDNSRITVDDYVLVRVVINWPDGREARSDGINVKQGMNALLREEATRIPQSIYAEILGGIESQNFWAQKHPAQQYALCNRDSLSYICQGGYAEPVPNPESYPKTQILQQDNYILSCRELKALNDLQNLW